MADYRDLNGKMIRLGKQSLNMCAAAGSGHPSSSLSLAHLTTALMYRVMRYDPKDPWNAGSDRLILSEGHAVPVVYAAYCDLEGVAGTKEKPITLKFEDALTLREADSLLDGHPSPAVGFPFFDAATGSLGQGLSVAAGLAGAARLDGSDRKIYCIIGDGESREGQIWEAVDFIVDHKFTAVRMIFNCNGQGQSDYVSQQQSAEVLENKLIAFGCEVKVIDGHDWGQVIAALEAEATDKPIAIIAKTVKGWGSTELQSKNYHGKPIKGNLLEQAIADLDTIAAKLGVNEDAQAFTAAKPAVLSKKTGEGRISAGSFAAAMKEAGLEDALEGKQLATRRAYGVALAALGAADERVVALDGDVKGSTFANMFAAKYADRYFEARIAEQNMISAAVGLAAADKIPFVSSFAKFLVRGYDQVELAVISRANIKLCGSHAGVSLAADGPSQMGLPDMAFIRSFTHAQNGDGTPAMTAFCPSDAVSAFKLTELMANTDGVCYMRTHRPDVEFLYDEDENFEVGGFKKLIDGGDLVIVASGYMVHIAKAAMEVLAKAGVSATLVDAYSMPLQTDGILELGSSCNGKILVVEDNYIGGITDEVTAAAARSGKALTVESMFVRKVPKSARTPEETLEMVSLTVDDIAGAARAICK